MSLDPHSRARLTLRTAERFSGDTLFARLARTVCRAECLPRKELFESWELARRVRRHARGGRIIDLAAGHGLLAYVLLILDDSSLEALAIDVKKPQSADRLATVLIEEWPRLANRVRFIEAPLDGLPIEIEASDLVVSAHACGALTDRVLDLASRAGARVAVLPCCHDRTTSDTGGLTGWVDDALAIDMTRAARLSGRGYAVRTMRIPSEISPRDRILLGTRLSEG